MARPRFLLPRILVLVVVVAGGAVGCASTAPSSRSERPTSGPAYPLHFWVFDDDPTPLAFDSPGGGVTSWTVLRTPDCPLGELACWSGSDPEMVCVINAVRVRSPSPEDGWHEYRAKQAWTGFEDMLTCDPAFVGDWEDDPKSLGERRSWTLHADGSVSVGGGATRARWGCLGDVLVLFTSPDRAGQFGYAPTVFLLDPGGRSARRWHACGIRNVRKVR